MADNGLLFIPDISGFTKFVNETEIAHSRIIIEELLENIINSNKMGLQVSEVEGDAILFYRFGDSPSMEEISNQVEKMFCNFQKQIKTYEESRMCVCAACRNALNLSLKIITHYGEFSSYSVKDFNKLIGKDVIVAHQLLKNDIDLHEYWLITDNLFNAESNMPLPQWLKWQQGNKLTENGSIGFNYSILTPLKEKVQPDLPDDRTLGDKKIAIASVTQTINAGIIKVLSVMGNLSIRHTWQAGVKRIKNADHPIYHLGIRFSVLTNKGTTVFYSSSFTDENNMFCMSETDENKTQSLYITLKPAADDKTSVTLAFYIPQKPFFRLHSLFIKKKIEKNLQQTLINLQQLLPEEVA
ncbi:MAG TPA: DUF2652 domain-containing protein [Parafilimonas sp.]|nr:DUF2652 domain-containing protein [Parafilimonas sp.]